jgi:hypothetical protein
MFLSFIISHINTLTMQIMSQTAILKWIRPLGRPRWDSNRRSPVPEDNEARRKVSPEFKVTVTMDFKKNYFWRSETDFFLSRFISLIFCWPFFPNDKSLMRKKLNHEIKNFLMVLCDEWFGIKWKYFRVSKIH